MRNCKNQLLGRLAAYTEAGAAYTEAGTAEAPFERRLRLLHSVS